MYNYAQKLLVKSSLKLLPLKSRQVSDRYCYVSSQVTDSSLKSNLRFESQVGSQIISCSFKSNSKSVSQMERMTADFGYQIKST